MYTLICDPVVNSYEKSYSVCMTKNLIEKYHSEICTSDSNFDDIQTLEETRNSKGNIIWNS